MTAEATAAAISRYERLLEEGHAGCLAHLRPGATDAELDAAAQKIGAPIPEDLRVLWAWHNGTDSEEVAPDVTIASGNLLFSLDQACDYGRRWVEDDISAFGDESELHGKVLLNVTFSGRNRLMVDAAVRSPTTNVVPTNTEWSWSETDLGGVSLAQVFEFWSEAIEQNFFTLDGSGRWAIVAESGVMPYPQRLYL
jgi:cell wall assembly regulator SMI1